LTPVAPTDDRGVSLQLPESEALVGTASPSTLPYGCHVNDTHEMQSAGRAKKSKYERERRRNLRAPKDSKVRRTVFAAVALKAQGIKNKEVAEQLGVTVNTLKVYMYRAHKAGWLNIESFNDPDDKLEIVLKSKVIRNVDEFLEKRDKDITIETAKGLGVFKTHQVVKNDTVAPVAIALSVQVEMPKDTGIVPREGSIGGAPYFDAEVVE
jgi:transposase